MKGVRVPKDIGAEGPRERRSRRASREAVGMECGVPGEREWKE